MAIHYADRRWTSRDGLDLYARDYAGASGPTRLPIICLHGLTRNSKDFEDLAPRLAASGRRILVPDVRGRGQSAPTPDPALYNPKIYARDVREMMRAAGISKAVFLGTSMGGIITMALATLSPKLVSAAILNDVGPEIAPEGVARIMSYVGQPVEIGDWDQAAEFCRRTTGVAFPDFEADGWMRLARRTFRDDGGVPVLDYDPHILAPLQAKPPRGQTTLAWFLFRRLARKRPVLLLRGEISDIVSRPIAERMKRKAPGMSLIEVAGVGHAPMLDEPDAIAAIDRFLDAIP